MSEAVKLNLRQKLASIYVKLDHVEKSGRNTKQNYDFVKAADMMRALRNAFAELGIYAETNYELLGTYDIKTNNGGNMHTATVKATIKLHDCDSDETMTISGLGDGADSGDKGIYKAQTGATKNALRNGSLMPDEADPEADESVDRQTDYDARPRNATPVQDDMPDFKEAKHAAPKAAAPRPTATVAPQATQNATASVGSSQVATSTGAALPPAASTMAVPSEKTDTAPEKGDAYEGPEDDGTMPTEVDMNSFRQRFKKIVDSMAEKKVLKASKGLPIEIKTRIFLQQIAGNDDVRKLTVAQWNNFFERADKALARENGLVFLAGLINKANGIEEK